MVLRDLYHELYGLKSTFEKSDCEELAAMMSKAINRKPAWTGDNIYRVLKGFKGFTETKEMNRAALIIGARFEGDSPLKALIADKEPKMVYSVNGLQDNDIILACSIRCLYCPVRFVPRTPNTLYCCPEHGRLFRRGRGKAETK